MFVIGLFGLAVKATYDKSVTVNARNRVVRVSVLTALSPQLSYPLGPCAMRFWCGSPSAKGFDFSFEKDQIGITNLDFTATT